MKNIKARQIETMVKGGNIFNNYKKIPNFKSIEDAIKIKDNILKIARENDLKYSEWVSACDWLSNNYPNAYSSSKDIKINLIRIRNIITYCKGNYLLNKNEDKDDILKNWDYRYYSTEVSK